MRQSIASGFSVHPAGEREVYFPMVYMNPFEDGVKKNLGWDGYSESIRRTASFGAWNRPQHRSGWRHCSH